jgi:hypothetical protein
MISFSKKQKKQKKQNKKKQFFFSPFSPTYLLSMRLLRNHHPPLRMTTQLRIGGRLVAAQRLVFLL